MGIGTHDIEMVKKQYPAFEIIKCENDYVFSGELILNHVFDNVRMTGKFNLEIVVPGDFPLAFPTVKELSNCIDENYPHLYENGQFCLASNLELKMFFSQDTDICSFIEKYVIPYLYTYRFYEEYGVYPYGERSHGIMGDLEYLKDLFEVDEWGQVWNIMLFVAQSSYRGHILCPCGSGKKIRNCHGEILKKVKNAELQDECRAILLELAREHDRKAKNGKCN